MTFALVDAFGIDGGELREVQPELAFALGVEWALIRQRIIEGRTFQSQAHTENEDRIIACAARRGQRARVTMRRDGWIAVAVEGVN